MNKENFTHSKIIKIEPYCNNEDGRWIFSLTYELWDDDGNKAELNVPRVQSPFYDDIIAFGVHNDWPEIRDRNNNLIYPVRWTDYYTADMETLNKVEVYARNDSGKSLDNNYLNGYFCSMKYIKKNMIFDLIKTDENFFINISNSLTKVYELANNERVFCFEYYDEIFRIPYRSIYYFEKNSNANSITLHTKNEDFIFYSTINDVMERLKNDDRFIKTHRSIIVNIHKIEKFDKVFNEIVFDNNKRLPIVCRRQKQNLINKLLNKINI